MAASPVRAAAVLALAWAAAVVACRGQVEDDDDDYSDIPLYGGGGDAAGGADGADGGGGDPTTCADQHAGDALGDRIASGNTTADSDSYAYCTSGGGGDTGSWSSGARDTTVSWVAPSSGTFTATTYGSSFDTMLTVLGSDCSGAVLGCNDDSGWDLQSAVAFRAEAGQTYIFVIDGYSSGESGPWQLNLVEGEIVDTGWW